MRRRRFLVGGAVALVLGPGWLKRAFADASVRAGQEAQVIAGALARARERGRPLAILIIPAKDEARDTRGRILGAFLNHANDSQLAPLDGVEIACATVDQTLALAASGARRPADEPLLARLDLDGKVTFASAEGLPPTRWEPRGGEMSEEASVERQIAFVADRVRALHGAATGNVAEKAAAVRARVLKTPPPGSHWANESACGFAAVEGLKDPEADEKMSMDCGMGHVPDKSARFLYFFNRTPARRELDQQARRGG